ncbi:hypothetical protein MJO52_19030 [Microbulbifer variabilis]|uniref:Uncharacterized protein n=1 Tax=Microbulbifer variabilis TaxID=266805 RepID=A0ABY4VA33_9GAMM|nr:hypothetical protein [Microbulbifer variabilis]USD21133.1 hypothetical protein MJO52_19030 [Microbulbifer variabilis]
MKRKIAFLFVLCAGLAVAVQLSSYRNANLEEKPDEKLQNGASVSVKQKRNANEKTQEFTGSKGALIDMNIQRELSENEQYFSTISPGTGRTEQSEKVDNASITRMAKVELKNNLIGYYKANKEGKESK